MRSAYDSVVDSVAEESTSFAPEFKQQPLTLDEMDRDALVILDFDETLFLSNSTEHFLNEARPSWLVAGILAVLAVLRPWRWSGGGSSETRDFIARDAWRVGVVCRLLPWVRDAWNHRAKELMIQYRNDELVDQIGPRRRTVVASYGFEFIIRPMLAGCGLNVERLVAGPLVDMAQWRSRGKAQAVRDAVDARSLSEAIAITDSPRDKDVLDAVAHPILRMWADVRPIRAQADVYIPLVYLSRVKRQGRREILRQVLLDDYMLVLLVFAGVNPWSTNLLLGLTCAFFSFFCVYEIGYRENDRLGEEFEANPRLTEAYTNGETGREPRWFPWIYGIALGVLANLFLHSGTADWTAVLFATALWLVFLLATRIIFAVYNRLDEVTRVYLFPWLQVAKTFGFLLLLPTTLAGGAAMLAQVIRRWQNYANYRAGGDEHRHPNLTTRVACYVLLITTLAMMTDQQLIWHWHTWLLLGWFVVRGAMQIAQSIQNVRWKGQPIFGR